MHQTLSRQDIHVAIHTLIYTAVEKVRWNGLNENSEEVILYRKQIKDILDFYILSLDYLEISDLLIGKACSDILPIISGQSIFVEDPETFLDLSDKVNKAIRDNKKPMKYYITKEIELDDREYGMLSDDFKSLDLSELEKYCVMAEDCFACVLLRHKDMSNGVLYCINGGNILISFSN